MIFLFAFGIVFAVNLENVYGDNFEIIVDSSQAHTWKKHPVKDLNQNYASDHVLVKFKGMPDITMANGTIFSSQGSTEHKLLIKGLKDFKFTDTKLMRLYDLSVSDAITLYQNHPLIEYIEPDYLITLDAIPNDPYYSNLWGMDAINAPDAWDVQQGNSDILVAVIDTGIDYTHEDLAANMWVNPGEIAGNGIDDDSNGYIDDVYGYDFANDDGDPYDDIYHGTHVAGTIAAVGDNSKGVIGTSPSVKVVAVKFIDSSGRGYISNAISAIEYSINIGAKISNNSWGLLSYSSSLETAISDAQDNGQIFVATAGNYGTDNDSVPYYPASYNLDNIVSVASTTSNNNLSSFSNYGKLSVDLGAPGTNIYSTSPGNSYRYLSGTSMAAPHVSGVLALMLSEDSTLSVADTKQILLNSTSNITYLDGITVSGGLLDAYAAVSNVSDESNNPPVLESMKPHKVLLSKPRTFTITATDVDGDTLSFNATGVPNFVTFTDNGNNTATFYANPSTFDNLGRHTITVTVSDSEDSDSDSFELSVKKILKKNSPHRK